MPWHYVTPERTHAQVPGDDLAALVRDGSVTRETLIWNESMPDWRPAGGVVPELFSLPGAQGAAGPLLTQAPAARPPLPPPAPPTSGLSIASLICGILSLTMCWIAAGIITGIPAVICGHIALGQIRRAPDLVGGRGLAIAGLVTGYVSILISVGHLLFFVLLVGAAAVTSS